MTLAGLGATSTWPWTRARAAGVGAWRWAGQNHPFMVSVAQTLAVRGISVVTFDFHMRERRKVRIVHPSSRRHFARSLPPPRAGRAAVVHRRKIDGRPHGDAPGAQQLEALKGFPLATRFIHRADPSSYAPPICSIAAPMLIVQGEKARSAPRTSCGRSLRR